MKLVLLNCNFFLLLVFPPTYSCEIIYARGCVCNMVVSVSSGILYTLFPWPTITLS